MTGRRIVRALALLAVACGAAASCTPSSAPDTVVVTPSDIRIRVTANGVLEAVESTELAPPMSVRRPFTIAWIVEDGMPVEAGSVVVRFDAVEFEKQLEAGLADRRNSQRRIQRSTTDRDVTIEKLDLDALVSRLELEHAEAFQTLDTTVYSRMEILQSTIDTELARHKADHALSSKDIQAELAEATIDLHRIAQERADIQVSQAEDGLAHLEIVAPHDGLAILERDWGGNPVKVGDTAWPGRTLARLPDLGTMQAEVWVLEADAGGLAPGQPATVVLESDPQRRWAATVESVDPLAAPRQRGVPVQYFRCVLALETTDPSVMKPGARVQAEIVVADLKDALTVPRFAIRGGEDGPAVERVDSDGTELVSVVLGPASAGRVVVASGLAAGDRIVVSGRPASAQPHAEPNAPPAIPSGTGG